MTDDQLDAAAERAVLEWENHERYSTFRGTESLTVSLARAWLARPRWRGRPTVPGMYVRKDVTPGRRPFPTTVEIYHVNESEYWRDVVWFGPLPLDTEATAAPPETPGEKGR